MRTLSAATFEQSLCGTNLECGTSITLVAGIWRFGSAIYQTTSLTFYLLLFRTRYLDSMTSCTPTNGRDRCRTTHTLAICMQPATTTLPKRAYVFTEGGFRHPPSKNPTQTKSGERIQGPDMSRRSRTLPAVTPGVGLTSTRHVRDTVESYAARQVLRGSGKSAPEVPECQERECGTHATCDLRDCVCRVGIPFYCSFCAAGAFLLSVPFGPSGCLYVF